MEKINIIYINEKYLNTKYNMRSFASEKLENQAPCMNFKNTY